MKRRGVAVLPCGIAIGAMLILAAVALADDGRSLTSPASEEDITALIRDLSDPVYEKRQFATRRLCAIGMPAAGALRAVAEGNDVEASLRAGAVLSALDSLMFAGVDVRLSLSSDRIAWNESLDLRVTFVNNSPYTARVPFEIGASRRTGEIDDARQVGDMLDAADLLRVRRVDGARIDLVVDDIGADEKVVEAVHTRLNGGPVSVLEAGQKTSLTVSAFNRGWARYRLLDADTYAVVLDYTPQWEDDVLAAERIGRVASNTVTVTVTKAAPETVSRSGAEASLLVELDGPMIAARIVNRTDQTVVVNKHFGGSPPFASGQWVFEDEGTRREIPVVAGKAAAWDDFDPALLVSVEPGQSIELVRLPVEELLRNLAEAGADLEGDRWTVHFSYANLANRLWQSRQGSALLGNPKAPEILRDLLPRLILSTRQTSNRLVAPGRG